MFSPGPSKVRFRNTFLPANYIQEAPLNCSSIHNTSTCCLKLSQRPFQTTNDSLNLLISKSDAKMSYGGGSYGGSRGGGGYSNGYGSGSYNSRDNYSSGYSNGYDNLWFRYCCEVLAHSCTILLLLSIYSCKNVREINDLSLSFCSLFQLTLPGFTLFCRHLC